MMILNFLKELVKYNTVDQKSWIPDAEYEPYRRKLHLVGLSEEKLRQMDPDDRVAVLENARLDPYDYIYLAC